MDVALENAQNGLPKVQRRMFSCEISQAKGQSGKPTRQSAPFYYRFSMNFVFSEPEPFAGLAFFFVCTNEKGWDK